MIGTVVYVFDDSEEKRMFDKIKPLRKKHVIGTDEVFDGYAKNTHEGITFEPIVRVWQKNPFRYFGVSIKVYSLPDMLRKLDKVRSSLENFESGYGRNLVTSDPVIHFFTDKKDTNGKMKADSLEEARAYDREGFLMKDYSMELRTDDHAIEGELGYGSGVVAWMYLHLDTVGFEKGDLPEYFSLQKMVKKL